MTGIALVEMACWDIMGKALASPSTELLGGAVRDKIKAYANGWYTVERDARGVPRGGEEGDREGLPGAQGRPVRRRASTRWSAPRSTGRSRWSRRCATRSGRTSRSWSRCTAASARRRPSSIAARAGAVQAGLGRGAGAAGQPGRAGEGRRAAIDIPVATGERIHTRHEMPRAARAAGGRHPPDGHHPLRRAAARGRRWPPGRTRTTCSSRRTTWAGRSRTAAAPAPGGRARPTSRSRSTSTTSSTRG